MENGKWKMENVNGSKRFAFTFSIFHFPFSIKRLAAIAVVAAVLLSIPSKASADPSQDAVFKSIQSNVDSSIDGKTLLAGAMAVGGVIVLMVFLSRRQDRKSTPRALNSHAKLLRELVKTAGLKQAEVRQLKALAERMAKAGRPVESPVTLMLAPSWVRGDRPPEQR